MVPRMASLSSHLMRTVESFAFSTTGLNGASSFEAFESWAEAGAANAATTTATASKREVIGRGSNVGVLIDQERNMARECVPVGRKGHGGEENCAVNATARFITPVLRESRSGAPKSCRGGRSFSPCRRACYLPAVYGTASPISQRCRYIS